MPFLADHHVCSHRRHQHGGDFTTPGAVDHYPPDLSVEPFHLDIDLVLDLESQTCAGAVTLSLRGRAGGEKIVLDAVDFEDLEVSDTEGRTISHSYDGKKLRVCWGEAFEAGEERLLRVAYRVDRPVAGLYFSKSNEHYPDAAWYAATDHETERARHWLPCVDLPNVRTTLAFHLTSRKDFSILANGALVGEEEHSDGTRTAHWSLDWPCPSYLVCFAIGDFTTLEDGEFAGIPLAYFCSKEHSPEDLQRSFGRTAQMLTWMTQRLETPFPFPKYYQFALPGYGGAMENISLVSWDDVFVLDEVLAQEWTWLVDQINVHEMAHSYFGDAVVCREFAHAWLKESWATYMETCWLEDSRGADEQRYDLYANAAAYFEEADNDYKRPIVTRHYNTSWNLYDRHLYPGGACRLHTLRSLLGDDTFWKGVGLYLQRFSGKVVETEDFRRTMEEVSGRSLVRFFEQWFYAKGYPSLKVSFSYDDKRKEGTFEVEQTQVDAKAEVPVFELDIDLAYVVDGEMQRVPVTLSRPNHSFVIKMPSEPQGLRLDPDGKVLHKLEFNPGDDKLRSQLIEAPDVVGRILAGTTLAETGKRKNLEAVGDAYLKEPFWGVRVRLARALVKAGTDVAVGIVAGLVGTEQDPMVIEHLLRAAGRLRDARVREALELRISQGLPYRAHQAALESLGLQRDAAPLATLEEAAGRSGFGGIVQMGAFRGLAHTRSEKVAALLTKAVAPGASSNRSRHVAAGALATLGAALDHGRRGPIVETLIDLLRDPNERVRWAAARGLRTLKAPQAIAALEAFKKSSLAAQDQVAVDRWISDIHSGQTPKVGALEKQAQEARDLIRKLEARLESLEAKLEAQ